MSVPKLRFKEFDGNWASLRVKDLVKSLDAGVSVNSEDIEPQDDEYSVLKTSCISSGYFDENERKRVLQDIEIQRLKEPVLDDSILMSRMNTPLLVGMNAYVFKAPKNTFLPDRLWQLKLNDSKTVTRWLAFYLGSDQGLNQIRDLASGTSNSMKNITKPDVLNLDLFVPSKPEQTKIASFLSSVDEKISQLTQKHELLSQYKQGMMQKLFSQTIRFKADDGREFGEWEEKKLSEISIKIKDGTHFSPKTFEVGEYKYLTSKNVKDGYLDFSNLEYVTKEEHLKIYSSCDVKYGDVLLTKDGTIGQCCVNTLHEEFSLLSSVAFLRLKPEYNNYFLYHLLVSDLGQKKISSAIAGQALKRITLTKINDFNFSFPCLTEQTKIAHFLSAIDQKIEVVAQKIEQAKNWKKGLLQQMFV